MMHLWGKNQHGTACIRCGYFNYTLEAEKDCSGRYDEKCIADDEAMIAKLTQRIAMIKAARVPAEDKS